jgi:YidC/Oxa1 family membrane protein insertase
MDRRLLWAVLLMMAIAFVPSLFVKRPPPPVPAAAGVDTAAVAAPAPAGAVASAAPAPAAVPVAPAGDVTAPADTIAVTTPLARYGVSTRGAVLTSLDLVKYRSTAPATKGAPVELIRPGTPLLGVVIVNGADTLHLDQWDFQVEPSSLNVTTEPASLTLTSQRAGHVVRIRYTFLPNDYQVGVSGTVSGIGSAGGQLVLGLGSGLANTEADSTDNFRAAALVTYGGSAERHDLAKLAAGETTSLSGPFSWTALKSKYFVTAILAFDSTGGKVSGVSATPLPTAGKRPTAAATRLLMPIATTGEFSYTLYAGPMEYDRLKRIGHDFDDVNPYGLPGFRTLIRFFAAPVRWLLVWMHDSLHMGYGLVLIAFGLLVRLLLWPLNQKAMRANTALQALQPQLQRIQEQYKSDPPMLQKKMFELYKENGVNPLGGCWPMLLPMPVLFALFFVLGNSIELRGVPFLWFPDLARPDPWYIIPVLSGLSMFGLTKVGQMGIQHTAQTRMQAQMMTYMMPVMITIFGLSFASGLNLYWTVSNLASIPQQWLIARERMKLQKAEVKAFVEIKTKPVEESGKGRRGKGGKQA